MSSAENSIAAVSMASALAACVLSGPVAAQAPSHAGEIPQSIRLEHENTIEQLTKLSKKHGPVGVEASKALGLFKAHLQREQEFILPPLSLLLQLADGKATPDMKWAIAMADRVKSERELDYQEHAKHNRCNERVGRSRAQGTRCRGSGVRTRRGSGFAE